MFTDRFDQIHVINLAHRGDRRREVVAELAKLGLANADYTIFPAIAPSEKSRFYSIGAHGVFLSQLTVLQRAAATDASVLILEDDCEFSDAARTFELTGHFDIFYGGYEANDADLHRADIIGAHCMGFSARAAKEAVAYLSDYLRDDFSGNPRELNGVGSSWERPGIDGAYVWFRERHPHLRTVFAAPPIARQRSSRSDIAELAIYDRLPLLRDGAHLLRRLKRKLQRG